MSCARTRQMLDAYVDGELDPATVAEIDVHFVSCSACAGLRAERRALSAQVRAEAPYYRVPERVRLALGRRLHPEKVRPRRAPVWSLAGALAAAGAAAGLLVGVWLGHPSAENLLLDEVVASHVASLAPGSKLVDVGSSDRHAVKPWFAGRTEFAPLVRDFSKEGFELVGGRLAQVGDRQAAAVVYRIRNHYVNLFMWAAPSGPTGEGDSVKVIQARGFPLATWSAAGIRYAAISDVQQSDLERFARLASEP